MLSAKVGTEDSLKKMDVFIISPSLDGTELWDKLYLLLVRAHTYFCFYQESLKILATNLLCLGSFEV